MVAKYRSRNSASVVTDSPTPSASPTARRRLSIFSSSPPSHLDNSGSWGRLASLSPMMVSTLASHDSAVLALIRPSRSTLRRLLGVGENSIRFNPLLYLTIVAIHSPVL